VRSTDHRKVLKLVKSIKRTTTQPKFSGKNLKTYVVVFYEKNLTGTKGKKGIYFLKTQILSELKNFAFERLF
jgi:hypothetical protein